MIIFLYGEDSYRSRQKLEEIVEQYKKVRKSIFNLIYVDVSKTDFQDFYNNFKIFSIFSEKKLVVVKNLFLNKSFQENFLEKTKDLESFKDVIVVYENEAVDQRLKIFKDLIKNCKCQEFKFLSGVSLKNWMTKEFEKQEAKINVDASQLLMSYVGSDLWRLSSEMQKLIHFKKGAVIKKEDVELLVRPRIEVDIFKTIDALAQKNKQQALVLLQKHLENGDSPLYLLSMVAYQVRNLLVVKELMQQKLMYASIVKRSGLHPFVVKKNYFQCNQFSMEELKNMYKRVFKVDSEIKTGTIEAETALSLLISGF